MPDIVITEFMDQSAVDDLSARFDVLYSPDLVDQPEELEEALAGARAIIVRNRTQVRHELLDQAPNLQVVGRLGVGLDNINLKVCEQRGATVYPATGANDIAVAEYVVGTAMILARRAYGASTQVINGIWPRQNCVGREIHGQVMGLIGCGSIARETAKRAQALGMSVIAYDPFVKPDDKVWSVIGRIDSLDELLGSADVISLHVPLTDSTRNLIDSDALSKVKEGAILINTARGDIVDEAALIEAMKSGRVGGASIDVFANEPVDEETGQRFADIHNLILTPHIAGVTEQSNVRVSSMIAEVVAKHLGEAK
ncbi:MAG: hydroxyacid dehydrogenase [Gammaproteobacteria bacterium]|nr:hydroxyacid dehydrogenase [Gammaproteobacteria bacterium]